MDSGDTAAPGGLKRSMPEADDNPPAAAPRRKTPETLRSARWFAPDDLRAFGHRSRLMQMGYAPEDWAGRPVIGILNTWSDINPCHAHFKQRVEDVKRGVLQAGGFPLELPAHSVAETFVKPSTMLYRNFLAMEAEELLRSHPLDGAVLMVAATRARRPS